MRQRHAAATGVQQLVHDTAARALAPYRDTGRFVTFRDCGEVLPGVRPVNLAGHTPGHTGYLLGQGDATVLFWGDTVHSHTVQLRRPSVTMAADSAEPAAIAARRKAFDLASMNRWRVGAAIGVGETFAAICELIATAAAKRIPLRSDLIDVCRSWLDIYIGHENERCLRDLVDCVVVPYAIRSR